ncbi:DUF5818 domain-containing protein [Sphingobium sp. WCS2017Hpa-17]|uniref:DUF5818 domain-containing protein n=1 Tax=Sphingobium sp. WCS2017Hpa-17 TaxID=3073638 RepID=UPI00288B4C57|nr:DUF5818 domain-containing protein [Sphingobium sp. WCS2017Hpa-17]
MPRGSCHDLTGILLDDGLYPILHVSDGGKWRLDISGSFRHLLGHKVRVQGTRSEFDMLDVDRIERS